MNVKLVKRGKELIGENAGEKPLADTPKIQWTTEKHINLKIFIPSLLFDENDVFNPKSLGEMEGYAEDTVSTVKDGEIVQFERFGFVRLEQTNDGGFVGFFTHK
jgi:hypothetical protein